jgi:uncharacterized protein YgbK (DUF1537 family)
MTYTHGEATHATDTIAQRTTIAQQKAADLQAALKLQRLEEANARTAAALQASEERTRQALAALQERKAAVYPVDPNWRVNRTVLDREVREYELWRRAAGSHQRRTKVPRTALRDVSGPTTPPTHSNPLETHTAVTLRSVS